MNLRKNRFPSTASMLLPLATFITLGLSWSSPLLSTPTAEAALFLGIFLAPLSFFAGACRGALRSVWGLQDDLKREGVWVFGSVFFYLLVLWMHSWTLQSCSPSAGLWPFLILLIPQLFLNLMTGIWVGRIFGQIKLAVAVSFILWLAYLWLQISLWWMNPSMRFFDLYWVMIVGDLLAGQSLDPAIIAYRMSTLLYGLALLVLGIHWKRHATQFWILFFLLGSGVLVQYKSASLISPTFSQRHQAYPDLLARGHLILHTDLKLVGKDHAKAVLQEGILWLKRLKERTGLEAQQPIHIWLYSSSESLAHYTGAKNIHFALPSHQEIHITGTEIPHPTLGHELAHVLLGQVSHTIWGIPGVFESLPNWGLSEGLATYLTPELNIREDLSTQEQATALYRLGIETEPEELLSVDPWSFWLHSSTRAYTASAAILGAYIDAQCQTQTCRHKLISWLAQTGDVVWKPEFLKSYHTRMKTEFLVPDALPSVAKYFHKDSIILADCSVSEIQKPQKETDPLKLPIHEQRQQIIQKVFSKSNAVYAEAGLSILNSEPKEWMQVAASYSRLGLFLTKQTESDLAYDYAAYLLARTQILGANFKLGLDWMPMQLEGLVGQEASRLVALSKSQIGQAEQAAVEFDFLKSQAKRPADRIRFEDMAERSRQIHLGERFLLGVW